MEDCSSAKLVRWNRENSFSAVLRAAESTGLGCEATLSALLLVVEMSCAGRSELVLALGGLVQRKGVIIFDSLVAFHPGSEQDSKRDWKYMDGFRSLASAGATVIVIHHSGKSEGSKEYRGSSDIKS